MCSAEQKSLVYIDIDSLTVNETAIQELDLLESQVVLISCTVRYSILHPTYLSEAQKAKIVSGPM